MSTPPKYFVFKAPGIEDGALCIAPLHDKQSFIDWWLNQSEPTPELRELLSGFQNSTEELEPTFASASAELVTESEVRPFPLPDHYEPVHPIFGGCVRDRDEAIQRARASIQDSARIRSRLAGLLPRSLPTA